MNEWNTGYYGKPMTPVDILVKRSVNNPGSAERREAVARFSKSLNVLKPTMTTLCQTTSIRHASSPDE